MAFSTAEFEDPWLRLAALGDRNDDAEADGGHKRAKAGGQERCDAIPPPSLRARLSVVATQHHLYEAQVAIPPHIAHILHMLEET